ncbi:MAG: type II toxin-antitoxin system PemK/MazF family toxin [Anaerolineae bacterium]|nr:type II toxin-antitoxin system PemK/MazF family toxin [Anaerolineae bacterium]
MQRSEIWLIRVDPDSENGLQKTSAIDTFQLRAVSHHRLVRKLGTLSDDSMRAVGKGLMVVLKLPIKSLE